MTTIIMLERADGTIHAAADRRITTDSGKYGVLDTPKLHVWDDLVVGCSGSYALTLALVDAITALTERTAPTIAKALRTLIREAEDDDWLDVLVGWKGHGVYQLTGDGAYFRTERGYAAIGSGAAYALGAMGTFIMHRVVGERCVRVSVELASSFDTGTDDNVDVITL